MITKTWLLLNAALFLIAAFSINNLVQLPSNLKKQKTLTANAVKGIETGKGANASQQPARNLRSTTRRSANRAQQSLASEDTWPQIRRGSLTAIWQQSLFSKDRTEKLESDKLDDSTDSAEEELPAPPNFELIGILTANEVKLAIIELKSNSASNRQQQNPRFRRPPMRQEQQPAEKNANSTETFAPTFVTAHEDEQLQETGYKVASIDPETNVVILSKDGLDYRLKLDKNNSNAAQRKDSQNTYAQSIRDKAKAAETKQAAAANAAQNQQRTPVPTQNNPNMPPMPPGATMPMPNNRGIPQRTLPGMPRTPQQALENNQAAPQANQAGNTAAPATGNATDRQPGLRTIQRVNLPARQQ